MSNSRFVMKLKDVGREDLARAGGKGANLGEMVRAGLPVPEGFVLLVDAYHRYVEENSLGNEIARLLTGSDSDLGEVSTEATARVQSLFARGQIPADIQQEIDRSYLELGEPPVAVRSSATAEDLPGASFAGQYTTLLNVNGREDLHAAIKTCWASLWNERAVSYRRRQNVGSADLGHGVVVQQLINSEKSGIIFTANPVNGRRDEISLSSSWGLGEAIVSGEVDPDQWVLHKKEGTVIREYLATKEVKTVRRASGSETVAVEPEKQNEVTLDPGERRQLLELARQVEEYFGAPQDIEWAYADGKFYLVQTRPVTALFPMPQPEDNDKKLHIYLNMSLYSIGTNNPYTPLTLDLWNKMYLSIARRINRRQYREPALWNKTAGGMLFFDITGVIKSDMMMQRLKSENRFNKDPATLEIILHLIEREKDQLEPVKASIFRFLRAVVTRANPWIIKYMLASVPKIMYGIMAPAKAVARAYEHGNRIMEQTAKRRSNLQTWEEKLEFIEQVSPDRILFDSFEILFYGAVSLNYTDKTRKLLEKHGIDAAEVDRVEKAVPNCVTTEMGMELLQIASRLDQAGEEPYPGHPEIKKFLEEYGHRANEELDLGLPRWEEEPEYVVSLVRSYIHNKTYQQGIEKFERDREEAEQAIEKITARLQEAGAMRDAVKARKWLRDYRKLYGIRELPKFIMLEAVSLFRQLFMEIGEELQAAGRLDQKEDIFMVTLQDIKSGEKLQETVRQNREDYYRETQRVSVPRLMTSTGETFYSPLDDESDEAYRGTPVSPGSCEGVVRVLTDPREGDRLKPGEIMVTVATNPGWTPLFMVIGGLVLETGGPISHGSVVAREYGIPAVVGVKEATRRFKDGQVIRINGETGRIDILHESPDAPDILIQPVQSTTPE